MQTFKCSQLFLICFFCIHSAFAQSYGNYDKVPVSLGLFPPISTNGANAGNCINQFSLNLIAGYSAGLTGLEFSGIMNTERDFVRGAQIAGFGNFVNGEFTGFQYAGFANFNRGLSNGFQIAGFANFNYAQADGVLAAGFFNFTNGKSLALQMAGFANFCEDIEGLQASGFLNVAKGNGKAIQMSGFANLTMGDIKGIQASGFLNYSKRKMQNVQASGFLNITGDDASGVQLAGFSNIAKGNMTGAQLSGFLNTAKKVNGLQLGFINIADTIESGIPIGFISIVKNGFRELELSFGDAMNTQLAFKTGVDKFYNIFAVGAQFLGNDYHWGYGYGVGTHLIKNEKFATQLEYMVYHINEGEAWTDYYNNLQQVKLNFSKKLNNHLRIHAGPSFNLMISDKRHNQLQDAKSKFPPYQLFSFSGKNNTTCGWIGFTAGLQIN